MGKLEMSQASQFRSTVVAIFTVLGLIAAVESVAQHNNPYRAYYGWAKLPEGRVQGVVAGIYADPDGKHMWLMDRCGGNNCAGVDVDPILKLDLEGNLVKSFGKGLFG
ncbi:MAG: hypothetical protein ACKVJN_17545, partial [Woeseiales bacterium]